MIGALEKFLAGAGSKIGAIKKMPLEDLVAMLGKKGKQFAGRTAQVVKKNPWESAAIGTIGAGVGAGMSSEDEEPDMDDDELMRAYGIR